MYRYSLDSTPKKHICPACKKKTFVRYKDSATNADLPAQYGRCDRELECTYHLNPYQDGYAKGEASDYILTVEEPKPPSLHTMQIVNKSVKSRENNFAVFLTTLLGEDAGDHLLKWKVGTSNKKWQGATIFWYITQNGDVRGGKVMLYDPTTGKRVKATPTPISWAHVLLGLKDFNLSQCLFGEHLLTDKPVCIVESEKTAIIASYYLPEFDWLATGGLSNLSERNTKVLSDKQVWLIPDCGGEEKWTEKAKYIEIKNGVKFNISKCLLGLEQGVDIADVLIESDRDKYIELLRNEITTYVSEVPATIASQKTKEYQRIEEIISFFHTNNLSASFEDSEKRMLAYSLGQAFTRNDAIELFIKSLSLDKQVIETNPKVLYDQFIEQLPKGKSYSLGILVNIFKKKGFIPKEFNPQRFWEIGAEGGIKFYEENFIPFLRGLGFYQWTFDEKFYQFVRVDAHLVRIVNEKNIVATANTEIESSSARVKNRFDVICKEYTSKTKLQQLPVRDFAFKKCTLKNGYLPFANGCVEMSHNTQPELKPYGKEYIWKEQQINFNLDLTSEDEAIDSIFAQFCFKAMAQEPSRLSDLMRTIGYMLHNYKDEVLTRAIIFTDERLSQSRDEAHGRTGKGLVMKAVSKMLPMVSHEKAKVIDNFMWENITPGVTQIYLFEEVDKDFDFSDLFGLITGNLTYNVKNVSKVTVPFERTPKFILTTNFAMKGIGASHEARQKIIEFSDYFNGTTRTPASEFGCHFFSDQWDTNEWNRFYSFMVYCLSAYLQEGLTETNVFNSLRKKLVIETTFNFAEFARTAVPIGEWFSAKQLTDKFNIEYQDYLSTNLHSKTMIRYIKTKLCGIYEYKFEEERRQEMGSRETYFRLSQKNPAKDHRVN